MATPSKPKKKTKKKKSSESVHFNIDTPIFRFITGSFFGVLALFTFVSLISYLFTWAEDQSLLTDDSLISSVVSAENFGGKLGFLWSNFLISRLFGLGAFIIPFFLLGISIYCFRRGRIHLLRLFFLSLMGAIVLSATFSYIFSFTSAKTLFGEGAGGSYGYYLNEWMVAMVGNFGAGIILVFFILLWAVLLNDRLVGIFARWFDSLFVRRKKAEQEGAADLSAGVVIDTTSEDIEISDAAPGAGEAIDLEPEFEIEGETADTETAVSSGENAPDHAEEAEEETDAESDEEAEEEAEEEEDVEEGRHRRWGLFGRKKKKEDSVAEEAEEDETEEREAEEKASEAAMEAVPTGEKQTAADGTEGTAGENSDAIPPVEVIRDPSNFSETLSDEEWGSRYDPRLSLSHYRLPDPSLLQDYREQSNEVSRDELEKNNKKIVSTLRDYKIGITKISARIGPTVTLYEIVPAPGVRVSQIKRLEEDIALSLAALGVRVVTLAGTNAIGIEVANERPSIVSMRSLLTDAKFNSAKYDLPVAIGRTISNEVMSFDLAKMPHLLVAGATGQGKSVGLNAIIASLLYKKHPSELKFVLVDPKKVELSLYAPLEKHYLAKLPDAEDAIITDTKLVVYTLKSLCKLMDHRYDLLKMASVRNIKEYNEKFLSRRLNPYKGHEFMPYIVVIIDEFADLLMTAGREVEEPIARLAQLARAIGIHLVIATQRPTTNIITGTIKANFPARIAFRVISSVDSKTILDQTGANQLIGRGDMLISTGSTEPVRVQCAFIDTPEIDRIARFISEQPGFGSAYLLPEYVPEEGNGSSSFGGKMSSTDRDDLFKEAARLIVREQQGSTSLIQRKMNLGYNRAGRIMDQLEDVGIVGPPEGSKPRQVRITSLESLEELLANL